MTPFAKYVIVVLVFSHTKHTRFSVWLLLVGQTPLQEVHVCCYLAEFPFSNTVTLLTWQWKGSSCILNIGPNKIAFWNKNNRSINQCVWTETSWQRVMFGVIDLASERRTSHARHSSFRKHESTPNWTNINSFHKPASTSLTRIIVYYSPQHIRVLQDFIRI